MPVNYQLIPSQLLFKSIRLDYKVFPLKLKISILCDGLGKNPSRGKILNVTFSTVYSPEHYILSGKLNKFLFCMCLTHMQR